MAETQEPYPEGIVVGPCICGSWPGGKCLKCPRTAPLTRITWDERGVRTVNGIPDDAPQQQAEPVAWDKPSDNFNAWWDGDRRRDNANPFQTDSFAYWAFEGWQAALAQRQWVGLTEEEIENAISDGFARGLDDGNVSNRQVIHYVRVIEAALKEKNHD